MRNFLIALAVIVALGIWSFHFVKSGKFEKYLDEHPNPSRNSKIEYHWANGLMLFNKVQSAKYRFNRIRKKYPKQPVMPYAWFNYIDILKNEMKKKETLKECEAFLEKFPDHEKAKSVKLKVRFLMHGY